MGKVKTNCIKPKFCPLIKALSGHKHEFVHPKQQTSIENGSSVFYCPMFCEGEKTYPTQSGSKKQWAKLKQIA
jgi:hypothetical protein